MRSFYTGLFIIILISSSAVSARSRKSSIENFIKNTRVSPEGFANTEGGQISIQSTTQALNIANFINFEVNNTLDILLYYQRAQNEDGGFNSNINGLSNWEDTIDAVSGLRQLSINSTQLKFWKIFDYLNSSATTKFYDSNINKTVFKPKQLNNILIVEWAEFIQASVLLGFSPSVPILSLISSLKNLQNLNGTYASFDLAVNSIYLLSLLGEAPNSPELASKYIRAFTTNNYLFSSSLTGIGNIQDSLSAVKALLAMARLTELEDQDKIILQILKQQNTNTGFMDLGSNSPNIKDTWNSINLLFLLSAIDELENPDVLQTEGFISFNLWFGVIGILAVIPLRRKLQ